jgi:hypothetical protein
VLAAGIGMFVWRGRRVEAFNPNDGDVEARKRDGRSRAVPVPDTSPHGTTADVGPDVRFSCGPNVTAVTGHAVPAASTSVKVRGGGSGLPVMASNPPAAPAKTTEGAAGGADRDTVVAKVLLGCLGWVVLIIAGVCYWHHYQAESKRQAEKDLERWQRSIEQAQQNAWEQRMRREGLKMPNDQPQLWDLKPPRR